MAPFNAAPILFESVSAVTATNSVDLGTKRFVGDEEYIYVYNAGGSQISTGRVATVSAVTGYSVTVSSVSGAFIIGACKNATLTTATYGWLVTKGWVDGATNGMASTALAGGDPVQAAADGAICKGETGPYIGKIVAATASAGTGTIYISTY